MIIREREINGQPITKKEIDELYSYQPSICKIKYDVIIKGKKKKRQVLDFFVK